MVVEGAATVVVLWLTPTQEQALEYLTLPEQADAYVGIEVGYAVTGLLTTTAALGDDDDGTTFVGRAVETTVE